MAAILKCKMCGGDIEADESMTVGTCRYCGSVMTLPKVDSEKKARLFNIANEYRIRCEFDKAYDAYQAISEEDREEPEAYWGMIISEYGIEYVEDPVTHKRVPTCHRTHIQSVLDSADFELACKYADLERRLMYRKEADEIDEISLRIAGISAKEEPYDVFICCKETYDETGERTEESILAHQIRDELEKKGIRTFLARVSLEDKLGQDYEPYIFSALTTARVMLHVTTSRAHSNSVWVKNEWSRYLSFMKDEPEKTLIPVYFNMSPYELPREFRMLQAQDMSRIGAMQDLVYGVRKLLGEADTHGIEDRYLKAVIEDRKKAEKKKQESRVRRAKIRRVVIPAAIAAAILALTAAIVLVTIKVVVPSVRYSNAQKLYGNEEYAAAADIYRSLGSYRDSAALARQSEKDQADRDELLRKTGIYNEAKNAYESGDYEKAIEAFDSIAVFEDSEEWLKKSRYGRAVQYYDEGEYQQAIVAMRDLGDYEDAGEWIVKSRYAMADELFRSGDYAGSYRIFNVLEYNDSAARAMECLFEQQMGQDTLVSTAFSRMDDFSEPQLYEMAKHLAGAGKYGRACEFFEKCLSYKDSLELWKDASYESILGYPSDEKQIRELYKLWKGTQLKLIDNSLSEEQVRCEKALEKMNELAEVYYEKGMQEFNETNWEKAGKIFGKILNVEYKDADAVYELCSQKIAGEMAVYEGVWYNDGGWTDLMIKSGVVYYTTDRRNKPNRDWGKLTSRYDADAATLDFTFWTKNEYSVTVRGNAMVLTWTNKEGDWDTNDWFSLSRTFTRSSEKVE